MKSKLEEELKEGKQEVISDSSGMITSRWASVVHRSVQLGPEIQSVGDALQQTFKVEMAPDY